MKNSVFVLFLYTVKMTVPKVSLSGSLQILHRRITKPPIVSEIWDNTPQTLPFLASFYQYQFGYVCDIGSVSDEKQLHNNPFVQSVSLFN